MENFSAESRIDVVQSFLWFLEENLNASIHLQIDGDSLNVRCTADLRGEPFRIEFSIGLAQLWLETQQGRNGTSLSQAARRVRQSFTQRRLLQEKPKNGSANPNGR